MQLTLTLWVILTAFELAIWLPFVWPYRRFAAAVVSVGLGVVSSIYLVFNLNIWSVLIVLLAIYRWLNLLRIVADRSHAEYLFHTSRKTSLWLIALQLLVYGINQIVDNYHIGTMQYLYALATGQIVAALVIALATRHNLQSTRPPKLDLNLVSSELPTVSVLIPARNETMDLELCLKSLLGSDYPKLEILVLDDCSQNKRTPEIIRDFAHDGVRFIAGKEPPTNWLAKNYAYLQLAEEANGEILIFCGVDVRFEPHSIKNLVRTLLQKQKSMISILPINVKPAMKDWRRLLVQPSRYAWELSLPRRTLGRPPVLSSCWMITREAYEKVGGLKAVTRQIVPESYFAKSVASQNDGYSFIISDQEIGIKSDKSFEEQLATAIRTRYPQLHRRPEIVALTSMSEFITLFWPLLLAIVSLITGEWILAGMSLIGYFLVSYSYARLVNLTYRRFMRASIYMLPFAAVYDIILLNYSMWQYEFSEVLWKGRNVCLPVMHITPALPKID